MKKKFHFKRFGILFIVCAILMAGLIPAEGWAASREFAINAIAKSSTKIKIGWKKKDVAKYVIYRANAKADGTVGTYKSIASVSGRKTSYVDKVTAGKYYSYRVYGYKKIDGKYKRIYHGEQMAYSGEWNVGWGEYLVPDGEITPESIALVMGVYDGAKPASYVVYRSEDGKNYQKLSEIKSSKLVAEYTDTSVETGKDYYYKFRVCRLAGKKKINSSYSEPIRLAAVNREGIYHLDILTPENQETTSLVASLTSDAGNAELVFENRTGWEELTYSCQKPGSGDMEEHTLVLAGYSYDNQNWEKKGAETISLKPGETLYLSFETTDEKPFVYAENGTKKMSMRYQDMTYNYLISYLEMKPAEGKAFARVNNEYYH